MQKNGCYFIFLFNDDFIYLHVIKYNMVKDQRIHLEMVPKVVPQDFPIDFINLMKDWDVIVKSPYGHSYYSAQPGWDYKEPDSYRISDHWNFSAKGTVHCKTTGECPNNSHWTIAKFNGDLQKYEVIQSIVKPTESVKSSKEFKLMTIDARWERSIANINKRLSGDVAIKKAISGAELSFLNQRYKILEEFQ